MRSQTQSVKAQEPTHDPISAGSFELERSRECAVVKRVSGDVFSGPRGYLVEDRQIEASGSGDYIWVKERFALRNRGKSCPTARCAGLACGLVQVRIPLPPHAGVSDACLLSENGTCASLRAARDDEEPTSFVIHVPMLEPGSSQTVEARFVLAAVPLYDGRSWLSATLPPRGLDERASTKVTVVAEGADGATTQHIRDTGLSIDLQVPTRRKAQPALRAGERTAIIIDKSPSMDGPAEGRVARVLAALLDLASPEMQVRFGFLRGDVQLDPAWKPVQALGSLESLLHVQTPPAHWLRATTEVSSLRALLESREQRAERIVLISDGTFFLDRDTRGFFATARRRDVAIELLNLDPRAVDPALHRLVRATGGAVRELGLRWDLVPRHLLDSYVSGALQLAVVSDSRGRPRGWKGDALRDLVTFEHNKKKPAASRGVPAESALRMLREQLVPAARACLRQDRKGRGAHSRRAVFEFELTRQEIEALRVLGQIPDPLRHCLYQAAAQLIVPRFEGRVHVRYPIYTERLEAPPTVKLKAETRALLDELMTRTK